MLPWRTQLPEDVEPEGDEGRWWVSGERVPASTRKRDNPRMEFRVAVDRMVVTGHRIDVPLDWNEPSGATISVHAREVVAAEHADDAKRPAIVWFQGGPGHEVAFPDQRGSWLAQLLTRYRVLLLDQRGTGLSTPLEAVRCRSPSRWRWVTTCATSARTRSLATSSSSARGSLWTDTDWYVFGQSFGGFCSLTYLSLLPEHIRGVIITGGFAPVLNETEEICTRLFNHVATRNADYYARFPDDAARVRRIVDHLETGNEVDGRGQQLSARRFLMLGIKLGLQHGAAELHGIIERAANRTISNSCARSAASSTRMSLRQCGLQQRTPSTRCCTKPRTPTARRRAGRRSVRGSPIRATPSTRNRCRTSQGEAVFPWMLDELRELQPLRDVADVLAEHEGWPRLYDIPRLRRHRPCCRHRVLGRRVCGADHGARDGFAARATAVRGSPTSTSTVRIASTLRAWPIGCSRCSMTSPHAGRRSEILLHPDRRCAIAEVQV